MTIYDASFNELSYDQRFNATYDGIYYVAVNAPYEQTADIYIRTNRTPEFYHLVFEDTDDTLEMDIWLSNIVGSDISVPSSVDNRLLMIRPYFIDPVQSTYSIDLMIMVESIGYFDGFMFGTEMNFEDTCYFYLPANETILIELSGDYEGMIGFEYQYEIIPSDVYDNVYDWIDLSVIPHLWMNEDNPIAHVDFTIAESGDYVLDVWYKDFFGSASKYAKLYSSEGTLIDGDWEGVLTLTAGDYYIEFTQPGFGEMFVLIMPKIIKQ